MSALLVIWLLLALYAPIFAMGRAFKMSALLVIWLLLAL